MPLCAHGGIARLVPLCAHMPLRAHGGIARLMPAWILISISLYAALMFACVVKLVKSSGLLG